MSSADSVSEIDHPLYDTWSCRCDSRWSSYNVRHDERILYHLSIPICCSDLVDVILAVGSIIFFLRILTIFSCSCAGALIADVDRSETIPAKMSSTSTTHMRTAVHFLNSSTALGTGLIIEGFDFGRCCILLALVVCISDLLALCTDSSSTDCAINSSLGWVKQPWRYEG